MANESNPTPKASTLPPVEVVITCTSRRFSRYKVEEYIAGIGDLIRSAGPYDKAREYAEHWVRSYKAEGRRVTLVDDKAAQS